MDGCVEGKGLLNYLYHHCFEVPASLTHRWLGAHSPLGKARGTVLKWLVDAGDRQQVWLEQSSVDLNHLIVDPTIRPPPPSLTLAIPG